MSEITKNTILHLAQLAQLELTESEIETYRKELTVILGFIDQLKAVEVSHLQPTAQVNQLTNITRTDQVLPSLHLSSSDLKQDNLQIIDHQIKVPKVNLE